MSKQNWRGGALTSPVPPVLVSCGTMEEPKVLTIAWTGTINTKPPKVYISVRSTRASYPVIKESGEFVINLATASLVRTVDFCGCKSSADTDKFAECALTAEPAVHVAAPALAECPISIECRVFDVIPLGSHDMFLADVVGISVDEEFIDPDGKLRLDKADLLAYAHGEYFQLGKKLGTFGFSVRKKPVKSTGRRHKKTVKPTAK
ncbi:MAG: flavin reductase family protein [Pygmaiobacter sp.]